MKDTDQIPLNTLIPDIYGQGFFYGKYYYVFNDTLFYLDIRVRHSSDDHYPMWCKVFHYDENEECYRFDMEDKIGKYLKVCSLKGLAEACIDVVNYEGEYFYNKLVEIKACREKLSLEDWKNLHIESFESKRDDKDYCSPSWSWKAVAESGLNTDRRRRLIETCPDCGSHLIEVFVSSPAWTWQNLCGTEGMLTFCPHCQKQIRYHMECMN